MQKVDYIVGCYHTVETNQDLNHCIKCSKDFMKKPENKDNKVYRDKLETAYRYACTKVKKK